MPHGNSGNQMKENRIAIVGTMGLSANYGGFETHVENLVRHHGLAHRRCQSDYCLLWQQETPTYLSAKLKYVSLNANGAKSILYEIASLFFCGVVP